MNTKHQYKNAMREKLARTGMTIAGESDSEFRLTSSDPPDVAKQKITGIAVENITAEATDTGSVVTVQIPKVQTLNE
jgi:hypothetical protein